MRTFVIANPSAASGRVRRRWSRVEGVLRQRFGAYEVLWTEASGDGTRLAREACQAGATRLVVVGGDGTLNEVVNGLFDAATDVPYVPDLELAVYPAGTGGDFVRSLGVADDDAEAWGDFTSRAIDVGRVVCRNAQGAEIKRYFVNEASTGGSGVIVDKVNHTSKRLGGKVSFYVGTLRGLIAYRNQWVRLRVDDAFEQDLVVNTVVVANGRYFGGSMMVAPEALLDDGLFDIIVIGDVSAATFVRHSGALYRGDHLRLPFFRHLRGSHVRIEPLSGVEPMLLETDGELVGELAASFAVMPRALHVLAPWPRGDTR